MESDVSNGRVRTSGSLTIGARGYLLIKASGGIWLLEADLPFDEFIGKDVTVEGAVVGLDRLRIDWIGPTNATAK
jgi:hypothetical protein